MVQQIRFVSRGKWGKWSSGASGHIYAYSKKKIEGVFYCIRHKIDDVTTCFRCFVTEGVFVNEFIRIIIAYCLRSLARVSTARTRIVRRCRSPNEGVLNKGIKHVFFCWTPRVVLKGEGFKDPRGV